jgi:thiol-disulfide isomerase/thioredoxin
MIQVIDVKKRKHLKKLNAAAKEAHDHPDTHGLLVKIYADWCGHCRNMAADWKRLTEELKAEYKCKKPDCVLTIANIRAGDLGPNDPIIQNIKYIPKDIQSVPTIMYISKGVRALEYNKERVYSEMLKWVISHPHFGLARKSDKGSSSDTHKTRSSSSVLRNMTKKARIKFKDFHRGTLKQFHKEMRRQHKKSVKTRMPTPVAPEAAIHGYIPAYLQQGTTE